MTFDLFQPICYVIEWELRRTIKYKNDTHGAFVISLCDCSEAFLASSVPDLKLNSLIVNKNCLDFEIDAWRICWLSEKTYQ